MQNKVTSVDYDHAVRENDFPEFRNRLREIRKNKHLTNAQMIEKIGCKESTFKSWLNESNYRAPSLEWLVKISEAFGVSLDYLMGKSDYTAIDGKAIAEITGLSDTAIKRLCELFSEDGEYHNAYNRIDIINEIMGDTSPEVFSRFLSNLYDYIHSKSFYPTDTRDENPLGYDSMEQWVNLGMPDSFGLYLKSKAFPVIKPLEINKDLMKTLAYTRLKDDLDTISDEIEDAHKVSEEWLKQFEKDLRDYIENLTPEQWNAVKEDAIKTINDDKQGQEMYVLPTGERYYT